MREMPFRIVLYLVVLLLCYGCGSSESESKGSGGEDTKTSYDVTNSLYVDGQNRVFLKVLVQTMGGSGPAPQTFNLRTIRVELG